MHIITTKRSVRAVFAASVMAGAIGTSDVYGASFNADFNGDGYEDLVLPMPYEDLGNATDAGAVKVVYGRAEGNLHFNSTTSYIHEYRIRDDIDGMSVGAPAKRYDYFGHAVAVGDFNHDGFDDIAISIPNKEIGACGSRPCVNSGAVTVVYGSSTGLKWQGHQYLTMQRIAGNSLLDDSTYMGKAITTGDFNGDGVDDLAVSYRHTTPSLEEPYDGGIIFYFGKNQDQLDQDNAKHFRHEVSFYNYGNYTYFGMTMTSGDFNADGIDDIAVSARNMKYNINGEVIPTGSVYVALGRSNNAWNNPRGSLFSSVIRPPASYRSHGMEFGLSMVAGNFSGDGRDELAIGAPSHDIGSLINAGVVLVANLRDNNSWGQAPYYQNLNNIPGKSQKRDFFGRTLAAADFNQDGYDDLAVGIPYKTSYSFWANAYNKYFMGEVVVLEGGTTNLYHAQQWHQDTPGVAGMRKENEQFGYSLGTGDFNNDGYPDLAVGIPREYSAGVRDSGSIQLFVGHRDAVTTVKSGTQVYHQGSFTNGAGFGASENEVYDKFGSTLLP